MLTQVVNTLFDSAMTALLATDSLVTSSQNLSQNSLLNTLLDVLFKASLYVLIKSRITVSHSMNSMILSSFNFNPILTSITASSVLKMILPNNVIIHDSVKSELITSLTQVIEEFSKL